MDEQLIVDITVHTLDEAREQAELIISTVEEIRADLCTHLRLVLEEAITNAIEHGNKRDPN